ncbi:MAG: tRNA guanosine(34) transglycosylase Tgt [Deltaproteobacteria bacterium]|nr:MAG: tRNA guanosine(34) transglycosylase Tgt [Deltaproteobacteria bacterium]
MTLARRKTVMTSRGPIETPVFMPVGTAATVKAVTVDELEAMQTQIILGNTYHLMLRPGHETIRKLGGLHQFMGWNKPILTDSGGFQVFSLAKLRKMSEEGVDFQSHIDGTRYLLTPEFANEIQWALGSDIIMVLDECPPYPVTETEARRAMELTIRWAQRTLIIHQKRLEEEALKNSSYKPLLFGIIQGSHFTHLRKECAERLLELHEKHVQKGGCGFSGFAIGGLAVGEPKEVLYEMAAAAAPFIPEKFPRYAMGLGQPEDLVELIGYGIDMFDCVIPTRNARNGELFTSLGDIQIKQAQYKEDSRPIDENCSCPVCKKYCRAYLRHLYLAKEILSSRFNSIHNLHYYATLTRNIRDVLEKKEGKEDSDQKENYYDEFRKSFYRNRTRSSDNNH